MPFTVDKVAPSVSKVFKINIINCPAAKNDDALSFSHSPPVAPSPPPFSFGSSSGLPAVATSETLPPAAGAAGAAGGHQVAVAHHGPVRGCITRH